MNINEAITKYSFISLILIGFSLHLLVFTLPLYDDAAAWSNSLSLIMHGERGWIQNKHLPIGLMFYFVSATILGISDLSLRIVPFIFNMLSIALLYIISKKIYNKTIAKLSVILALFTYLPFFATTIVDADGSLIIFFSLLGFFSIHKYFMEKKEFWWFLSYLISANIIFFLKPRTLFVLMSFLMMILIYTKNLKTTIKHSIILGLSIIIILAAYFSVIWFTTDIEVFKILADRYFSHNTPKGTTLYFAEKVFNHFKNTSGPAVESTTSLVGKIKGDRRRYFNLILYLTPLYILIPLLQSMKLTKDNILPLVWILPTFILQFLGYPFGTLRVPRYLSILYPPLIIMTALFIRKTYNDLRKSRNLKVIWLSGTLIFFAIFSYLNKIYTDYWTPSSSLGPIFNLSFSLSAFVYLISFFLIAIYILSSLNYIKIFEAKKIMSLFLIFSLGFNIFLISLPLLNNTHRLLIKDLQKFSEEIETIKQPIYGWNEDIPHYLNKQRWATITLNQPFTEDLIAEFSDKNKILYADLESDIFPTYLSRDGGTVFLLNYPDTRYNGMNLKAYNAQCHLINKSQYDYGNLMVYRC